MKKFCLILIITFNSYGQTSISSLFKLNMSTGSSKPKWIKSASGLVATRGYFFVVDDEKNKLFVVDQKTGELKEDIKLIDDNKKHNKSDFESISLIPKDFYPPFGALIILPSGKGSFQIGCIAPFSNNKTDFSKPKCLTLRSLFNQLINEVPGTDTEGMVISPQNNEIIFIQRGNGSAENGLIHLKLTDFLDRWDKNDFDKLNFTKISRLTIDIGENDKTNKVYLSDGTILPSGEILFSATKNPDKKSKDSDKPKKSTNAIGILDKDDNVKKFITLNTSHKIEGITAEDGQIWILNDDDGDDSISEIFTVEMDI